MTSPLVLPGGYRYSSGGQQRSGGGGGGGGRRNYKPVDLDFESEARQDTMGFKPDDFNPHETARYGEIASAILNFFVCCMEMG